MKKPSFFRTNLGTAEAADFEAERRAAIRRAAAVALQRVKQGRTPLIAIAGPRGSEGATVVGEALAETLGAHSGGHVVLIDGARRDGEVPADGPVPFEAEDLASQLQRDAHANFSRLPGFPVDRFSGHRGAEAFTAALRQVCDMAVIVLPPLLTHPEALSMAAKLDGVVLVLEAERTRWEVAREAKHLLDNIGVQVLGAILNKRPRYIPDALYRRL